jgi:hypothetical protein
LSEAEPQADAVGSIRFEKAEFSGLDLGTRCAACSEPLVDTYFEVNGATVCPRCREQLASARSQGTRAGRFGRALGGGLVAAAIGAALYYGVRAVTGYELGLIAIVVGLMVGSAVRWGSHARGGWLYQALAIGLTYLSIVSTYLPFVIEGFREVAKKERAAAAHTATATTPPTALAATSTAGPASAPAAVSPAPAPANAARPAAQPGPRRPRLSLGTLVLALVFIAGIALFAPFLAGFENFMGWVIIGIALYEAWKINRLRPLAISGPFRLAARPVVADEPPAPVPA